jgi:hypothetical protein
MSDFDNNILFVNNLQYKCPASSSVCVNRVLKRQLFQQRAYGPNQTATLTLNTGTDFVDTKNSSLVVKIKTTATGVGQYEAGLGTGSALNIFSRMRIYHRSGTCYTNSTSVNLWSKINDRGSESQQWFDTVGKLMGYSDTLDNSSFTNVVEDADEYEFVIPLDKLHPFFDPNGGVFGPPQQFSGLRIELDLAPTAEAFTYEGNEFTQTSGFEYSVTDIYLNAMSVALTDNANATINVVAAKSQSSLEYIYNDIFTSISSQPSDSTVVNIDINKSCGFATSAVTAIRRASSLTSLAYDAFKLTYAPASYWYLLGSNQYPLQKLNTLANSYHTSLITFDKFKSQTPTVVTPTTFSTQDGIYSVSLERDTMLALSASIVNASRALRLELTLDATYGYPTLACVFLNFISSARTNLLSSKVEI